jgi:hypothetical protein
MLGGLRDTFTSLMESAQKMGLEINKEKAMYIYIHTYIYIYIYIYIYSGKNRKKSNSISIGEYKFQRAGRFKSCDL